MTQPSSRTFWTIRSVAFVLGKHEVTRGVGNFVFVQMSNRMRISVQGYVTLELHLRSVGSVHDGSFAWGLPDPTLHAHSPVWLL